MTIPRTAQTQYQSKLGRHFPRAEAAPGDMLFWADGGDCVGGVAHVGIFMRAGEVGCSFLNWVFGGLWGFVGGGWKELDADDVAFRWLMRRIRGRR